VFSPRAFTVDAVQMKTIAKEIRTCICQFEFRFMVLPKYVAESA
jgi:predicted component of type VI protein secretion system